MRVSTRKIYNDAWASCRAAASKGADLALMFILALER
jgi:hypothetical protein